jgi:hypothetical protein
MSGDSSQFGVCLFCSASPQLPEAFFTLAADFGSRIARNGYRLVYGGSTRGLMGAAAKAAHDGGAEVLGVMPPFLVPREGLGTSFGETLMVETLPERKQRMADASHAFVAIPGGIGTLDEVSEMITWNELSIHSKPVYLVNQFGFWDPIIEFFARGRTLGVIRASFELSHTVVPDLDALFAALRAHAGARAASDAGT